MTTGPRRAAARAAATRHAAHAAATRHAARRRLALAAVLCACTILSGRALPSPAHDGPAPLALEQSVKAAFLYKFLSYVEWPLEKLGAPDAPLVVGVIDAPELASELAAVVADRRVGERPIEVRELEPGAALDHAHAIFVGRDGMRRLRAAAAAGRVHSILLVTETEDALERGSVINFVEADGRIRFEVSLPAAESSGLKLSSRLLAVAKSVAGRPR